MYEVCMGTGRGRGRHCTMVTPLDPTYGHMDVTICLCVSMAERYLTQRSVTMQHEEDVMARQ